ncbi:MAG: glycosyltransferase [Bacteroidales bacterium]|nr:glycosyltransferase [Bacteroidales bacterium]
MTIKLSVVICAYNRASYVYKGLTALNSQTADNKLFEVIVVDNNSTDNTKEICCNFIKKNPKFNLKFVRETKQGLSFARNKGIEVSNAEIISYIDDDAVARKDYIENLIKAFDNNPDYGALGGKVIPVYENGTEPVWMSKYIFGIVSKVDYGDTEKEFTRKFPTGCNMAFRKKEIANIGGFNTDLVYRGDDKFVFLKLKENNIKILYAPNVFVEHFIEEFRTTPEHIRKVSRTIGASEKLRLKNKPFKDRLNKSLEYFYKLSGSLVLFVIFTLKGEYPKGKYAVIIIWQTVIGYFSKKNYANL